MKHALVALVLFVMALPTFADDPRPGRGHGRGHYRPGTGHHRPHRPGPVVIRPRPRRPLPPVVIRPRPMPRPRTCEVVMTDRFNRVVRRYWGHSSPRSMCREGLRQCQWDLNRMGAWGYRCATVRW